MNSGDRERDASPLPPSRADTEGPGLAVSPGPAASDEAGLRLEVIAGNAAGTSIRVEDELVVGRYATGAGQLSEDSEISRHHARISREASGNFAIEDLGSSNGTFVNGLRTTTPQLLAVGDSIEVGATTLVVRSIVDQTAVAPADTQPGAGYAPTIYARAAPHEAHAPHEAPAPHEDTTPRDEATPGEEEETEVRKPGPLTLRLEVDFEAREASIALGEGGEPVRMVFENGRWQTPQPGS